MGHYAIIDTNNIVINVITGRNENEVVDGVSDWETYYGNQFGLTCKRTSYNTYGNEHKAGGEPFRKNYAEKGYTYDPINNAFIPPKPYDSWVLNTTSFLWEAPTPYPNDGQDYGWNEETQSWDLITE
jgi:hypothetical protein